MSHAFGKQGGVDCERGQGRARAEIGTILIEQQYQINKIKKQNKTMKIISLPFKQTVL